MERGVGEGFGEGLGRGWGWRRVGEGVGEGLGSAWLSILPRPRLTKTHSCTRDGGALARSDSVSTFETSGETKNFNFTVRAKMITRAHKALWNQLAETLHLHLHSGIVLEVVRFQVCVWGVGCMRLLKSPITLLQLPITSLQFPVALTLWNCFGINYKTVTLTLIHAQYDWTTGVPDNGNDWRKFCAVPRSYPLRSLVLHFV